MLKQLPRILSPNLGCPFIVSPEELGTRGIDIVMAEEKGGSADGFSLLAHPSYSGEGRDFFLELKGREELTEDTLPPTFQDINETRFLISTTLRSSIFAGKARFFRYRAKPPSHPSQELWRRDGEETKPALYDLTMIKADQKFATVFHALCLRPRKDNLNFIHLTDLHIALRNDLYAGDLHENITLSALQDAKEIRFNNFNENLRRFIRYANRLRDEGSLDFVMITGDLVDFVQHGCSEQKDYGQNNYRVFRDLILGAGKEKERENPGLKVPIFTSTGNHDWRFYPYSPELSHEVFRIDKKVAEQLDRYWADEQEGISRKIEEVYKRLLGGELAIHGSAKFNLFKTPVRGFMQWIQKKMTVSTETINKYLQKAEWQKQFSKFIGYTVVGGGVSWLGGVEDPVRAGLIVSSAISALINLGISMVRRAARLMCENLLSIEAGWQALRDYFLTINPYFNYGFRLGDHFFLILDTGHDCMRAQYLWDDGDKKMGPLSIQDNTIGQSPDSMALYDINEYYPYSQIGWIHRIIELINEEKKKVDRPIRVFMGLHAPPANLSTGEVQKAEQEITDKRQGLLLAEGRYDIRYGTINHYLSHFLHLCLGRIEQEPAFKRYHTVDVVLSGHAHWTLEFRLAWDEEKKRPLVYFGDFTGKDKKDSKDNKNHFQEDFDKLRPFLLQTPGCGPREDYSPEPPYFRLIEIDGDGKVLSAEVLALKADGTAFSPNLST